jgi:hypothetical protein
MEWAKLMGQMEKKRKMGGKIEKEEDHKTRRKKAMEQKAAKGAFQRADKGREEAKKDDGNPCPIG